MAVEPRDASQICSWSNHLDMASQLDATEVEAIRTLARQLAGRPLLPLLGAGASFDCGVRLAGEIGQQLEAWYRAQPSFDPHAEGLNGDLGQVADAIWAEEGQSAVVRAIRLHEPACWPSADDHEPHFCAYSALGRLAREGFVKEAIGFNYDCGAEAAFQSEGFSRSPNTTQGREWMDHMSVVADRETNARLLRPGAFQLFKAHGSADRYREMANTDEAAAAETIVIRKGQLVDWRTDGWIRDVFRERARNHVLLLIGFSGQDPVIYSEIQATLNDVYAGTDPDGMPRVVVMDFQPNTAALRTLVRIGLGGDTELPNTVTTISTSGVTTTAATLAFLAEALAHSLEAVLAHHLVDVPSEMDGRLAMFTVSGPVMMRWSYLLRRPERNQFMQRMNLQQAARTGYVPLTADPDTTGRAARTRQELRRAFGETGVESAQDAFANHGFLVRGASAFLPVGLDLDELVASCRPGGGIDQARSVLEYPTHLECVLVADDGGIRRGVNMHTGRQVPVP